MERIDEYELEKLLGEGGFGSVYAAHHRASPDQRVALKVLHADLARRDEVARRFFQEALVLARMEHPQLPRILSFGPWQGTYYLVQELIEGSPWDAPPGGLPLPRVEHLLGQLLEALAYAHERGVVHRDLKPSNVLIAGDTVRVLDFGLAAIVGAPGTRGSSDGIGTLCWSAPEQLRGEPTDARADLFAAGMLLHLLLTGQPPVSTDDAAAYLAWAGGDRRDELRHLRPDVPRSIEVLYNQLTHPDPARRPASAAEALGALRHPQVSPHTQVIDAGTARMTVRAAFDREAYDQGDDPLCRVLLTLELAPGARPPATAVSADISLVLDVSGSMDTPDKYPLLRRALAEFLRQMSPRDRVGLIVFSHKSEVIAQLTPGEQAAASVDKLVAAMDRSGYKFGNSTHLAPGLKLAREQLEKAKPARGAKPVRRVYVLTDGELHDTKDCEKELAPFAEAGIEIQVYGFGSGFNGAALKQLVSEQRGGSVKPICNEQDVIETFAHIAQVNRRLLGQDGALRIEFSPSIDVGDAWLFRPQERHLGLVRQRLFERPLGGVEATRPYAMLFELRLPPAETEPTTAIATVTLRMHQGTHPVELTARVQVERQPGGHGAPVVEVTQVLQILEALRSHDDQEAERTAAHARLALAIAEQRDPGLIDALRQQIDILEGRAQPASLGQAAQQYLDSDMSSMAYSPSH